MAVTFSNNFKNILDKLESLIETEFKGALPVYKGKAIPSGVNQAIQLTPTGSTLEGYMNNLEEREFSINMRYIFSEVNINEKALDHILRQASRIEALIYNNIVMTLVDPDNPSETRKASECRIESTDYDADADSNFYVVTFDFKCKHTITF